MIDPYSEAMIKRFESCKLIPYKDVAGYWTIGWGRKINNAQSKLYYRGITQTQADMWLFQDLKTAWNNLHTLLHVNIPVNQSGSLTSLAFNVGVGKESLNSESDIIQYVNDSKPILASLQFYFWDHAGGVEIPGLKRRRLIEKSHFLKGPKPGENINSYINTLFSSVSV